MEINRKIAVVTGAASGIGRAVATELARRGAQGIACVDLTDGVHELATTINAEMESTVACGFEGNVTDSEFRARVFDSMAERFGVVDVCVPAAGITRDALSVKVNRSSGKPEIYPLDTFRQVVEVDLIAPIYWALETVARVAEMRHANGMRRWDSAEGVQGAIIFIGSVSSQGNKGQLAYAASKAGLEGAAATLMKEAMFHGVRAGVIHPGFTDTPMVRAMGEDYIEMNVLPATQLQRLIRPEEIADAICFMISNSAVSGQLYADAGWHPAPA